MRTISIFSKKPDAISVAPIGDGKRAWVYVRRDIQPRTVTDEDGTERTEWIAVEYSTQVNILNFEITNDFIDKLIGAEKDAAAKTVRAKRNRLLEQTDKEMLVDRAEPGSDSYNALSAYRQALRDVPEQKGFPFDIEWPVKPEN